MHFCTSFIRRTIWTIGLMLWGIVYCHAYHFQSTSAYRSTGTEYRQSTGFNTPNGGGRIADFPTPVTATFKGGYYQSANRLIGDGVNIYEPFTPGNPSDNNNPSNTGDTSDDDEEEVIPGTPSDPLPPTEYPIGELWILLLFAAASAALIYIKNKTLTSEKH